MEAVLDFPTIDNATPAQSRLSHLYPNTFRNQSGAAIDDEGDLINDKDEEREQTDEPTDEDGDPTGEHDHHQDDNYALGGHVTRSGSV
ncbi:hypothetical protein [Spirosoma sp. KUDC1026]|uniref:hypothetical protein n=1 Tax=Spirosoma sp. KUDC1026 TaxID=2745947 RepID=UPI00159BC015|nr:hypothetical protein [Spirosoma sp. KUDC1026]QKZ15358.1 hypothetical protein HU175_23135 [Spirosoma sp. KUDC1026]